jgi:pimeloyl-ACP methyl ester carboxylesterase
MKRFFKWIFGLLLIAVVGIGVWGYAPDTDPTAMRAKYATAASQFIDIGGGLKVHVRDEGKRDGPALVLLHGSNSSLQAWEPWVKQLGDRYRLISLDQIGHGLTGPNPTGDYSAKAFVTTLDSVVSKLGVSKFALAGNSMGGWIAWNYALAHPDKVDALVLVDAGGAPDDPSKSLPIGFRIARTPGLNRLMSVLSPRSIFDKSIRQTITNQALVTDAMIDRYWELNRFPGNRDATRLRGQTDRGKPDPARLAAIKAPVLILWGTDDKLIPVAATKWFKDAIPQSKVIIYPGVGHLPMEEEPEKSAADTEAFLSEAGLANK